MKQSNLLKAYLRKMNKTLDNKLELKKLSLYKNEKQQHITFSLDQKQADKQFEDNQNKIKKMYNELNKLENRRKQLMNPQIILNINKQLQLYKNYIKNTKQQIKQTNRMNKINQKNTINHQQFLDQKQLREIQLQIYLIEEKNQKLQKNLEQCKISNMKILKKINDINKILQYLQQTLKLELDPLQNSQINHIYNSKNLIIQKLKKKILLIQTASKIQYFKKFKQLQNMSNQQLQAKISQIQKKLQMSKLEIFQLANHNSITQQNKFIDNSMSRISHTQKYIHNNQSERLTKISRLATEGDHVDYKIRKNSTRLKNYVTHEDENYSQNNDKIKKDLEQIKIIENQEKRVNQ